ncbi:unnamed protein product [Owenia fusiformis]|uniref:Protein NO VEIN C-terminal domain-containing protein n=1 Tax=Owenia fusiformis TaxID=6347 RepID=A0A8S4PD49_OWEFU|nr:unnamed protein product [Owenia fusiformis]
MVIIFHLVGEHHPEGVSMAVEGVQAQDDYSPGYNPAIRNTPTTPDNFQSYTGSIYGNPQSYGGHSRSGESTPYGTPSSSGTSRRGRKDASPESHLPKAYRTQAKRSPSRSRSRSRSRSSSSSSSSSIEEIKPQPRRHSYEPPKYRTYHPPASGKRKVIRRSDLDMMTKEFLGQLSESGVYVGPDAIEGKLLQHYNIQRLNELQGIYKVEDIQSAREHLFLLTKINTFIYAYVKSHAISTLYDLSGALLNFLDPSESKKDFKEFGFGPLQKNPIIYELFQFPHEAEVPQLSILDVMVDLHNLMRRENSQHNRVEIPAFMEYLVEKYNTPTPYELGIKIRSFGLAIMCIRRAAKEEWTKRRGLVLQLFDRISYDVASAFQDFRDNVFQSTDVQLNFNYIAMHPLEVLEDVHHRYRNLLELAYFTNTHPGQQKMHKKRKLMGCVDAYFSAVAGDPMAVNLFHLSIMSGQKQVDLYDEYTKLAKLTQQNGDKNEDGEIEILDEKKSKSPHLNTLVTQFKKYLARCLEHGNLTLLHFAKIEEKLMDEYHMTSFKRTGFGTFLNFVTKNIEIKKLIEESCGLSLGGGQVATDSPFSPKYQEILAFVKQCGVVPSNTTGYNQVEEALCKHYCVKDVKDLHHGGIARLMNSMEKQKNVKKDGVIYESAMCVKPTSTRQITPKKVGLFGQITKDDALICLNNCPLLEDLEEWSNWNIAFEPELGTLKTFVDKYSGIHAIKLQDGRIASIDIGAIEIKPGVLLKIINKTSPMEFARALENCSISSTCGHLVSLIAVNKGVENTPLALLANHMKTGLLGIQSKALNSRGPHEHSRDKSKHVVQFVLELLGKLPLTICQTIADQVILEPLSHVVGSTKSKMALLECANRPKLRGRLQVLGASLGVQEWSDSFQERLKVPEQIVQHEKKKGNEDPEDGEVDSDEEMVLLDDEDDDEETDEEEEQDIEEEVETILDEEDEKEENDIEIIDEAETPALPTAKKKTSKAKTPSKGPVEVTIPKPEDEAKANQMEVADNTESNNKKSESEKPSPIKNDSDAVAKDESIEAKGEIIEMTINPEASVTDQCKALIDTIRLEEFGIDVVLSEHGQKLMVKQQERLGRSLDRLSKDLYSKDTHFVLELIQNADDNSYSDTLLTNLNDDCPAVKFIVNNDCISMLNNEKGFQERDMRAICDVGKSTKGKHKFGYIGQKGIGFKSVFRVTDRPEIHSSGFHICFDTNSGPMGFILPHWIGGESLEDKQESNEWTTRINLPLKQSVQEMNQSQSLAARFHDVHPSLLLFLHRLRSISIENKVEGFTSCMRRRDMGENIIEIEHSGKRDKWLVLKKTLDASEVSLQAKSGIDVESTEIALAFPLQPEGTDLSRSLPSKQPVFAFLPLRSYGFRFVVQGDFDVPSSREDVDRDSSWNQWLRSEIHLLFIESLDFFKEHPLFNPIQAVCSFFQFVPYEDEILDFFRPVASQILLHLKATPCLPTTGLQWKLPSQLVTSTDPLVREVLPSDLLQECLNLDYLHTDVANVLSPAMMECLGVQTLQTQSLIEVGKVLSARMAEDGYDKQGMHSLAKWLVCIYRSLDEFYDNTDILRQLQAFKIIPLQNGEVACLKDTPVYFTPKQDEDAPVEHQALFTVVVSDLMIIDEKIFDDLGPVTRSQLARMLELLGLKDSTPRDIINHHIIPIFKHGAWQEKAEEILMVYVMFIKYYYFEDSSTVNLDELKPIIQIITNKGLVNPATETIHFSTLYGNSNQLQELFPGYEWTVLSSGYINKTPGSVHQLHEWREFFSKLGIIDSFAITPNEVRLDRASLKTSHWAELSNTWPETEDEFIIHDYSCDEIIALVSNNQEKESYIHQMRRLVDMLNREWTTLYSRYIMTYVTNKEGTKITDTEASFALFLKQFPWLPAIIPQSEAHPGEKGTSVSMLLKPGQLWLALPEIKKLLSDHVPYLDVSSVTGESTLCHFLGISYNVTVDFMKEMLMKWSLRPGDCRKPQLFKTSVDHMMNVYRFLQDNLPAIKIQEFFEEWPVIFYPPATGTAVSSNQLLGKFLSKREVYWFDPSGVFSKYEPLLIDGNEIDNRAKIAIQPVYGILREFFMHTIHLTETPSMDEYIKLIVRITEKKLPNADKAGADILAVMSTIANIYLPEDSGKISEDVAETVSVIQGAQIRQQLARAKVFPTNKNSWVCLDETPLLVDDKNLEKMFGVKEGVHLLNLNQTSVPVKRGEKQTESTNKSLDLFIKTCQIKTLSECVEIKYLTESFSPCPSLQAYMHLMMPPLQTFMHANHSQVYTSLNEKDIATKLNGLQFGQVEKLEAVYSIKHRPDIIVIQNEKCRIRDTEFCVQKDHVETYFEINREIAKYFSDDDATCMQEIRNFLVELMPSILQTSPCTIQEVIDRHDLDPLPESEVKWEVKPPVIEEGVPEEGEIDENEPVRKNRPMTSSVSFWPPKAPSMEGRDGTEAAKKDPKLTQWPPRQPQVGEMPNKHNDGDMTISEPVIQENTKVGEDIEDDSANGNNTTTTKDEEYIPLTINNAEQQENLNNAQNQNKQTVIDEESEPVDVHRNDETRNSEHDRNRSHSLDQEASSTLAPGETEKRPYSQDHEASKGLTPGENRNPDHGRKRPYSEDQEAPYTLAPGETTNVDFQPPTKRMRHMDVPEWTEAGSVDVYEDLDLNEAQKEEAPEDIKDVEEAEELAAAIGLWGEKLVHKFLLSTYENTDWTVEWCNEESESGWPYDFRIISKNPTEYEDIYIEVKATKEDKKNYFDITQREVMFAHTQKQNYHLYRVYNAGQVDSVRLCRLQNLSSKIQQNLVRLCMFI